MWVRSLSSFYLPALSGEVKMIAGHLLLTFSGWVSCALAFLVLGTGLVAANKGVAWFYSNSYKKISSKTL